MDITNSFYERLAEIKKYLNIKSDRSFAQKIGISPENIKSYKKGSQPSLSILVDILSNIEGLNPEWLLTGTGSMFVDEEEEELFEPNIVREASLSYQPNKNEVRRKSILK